MGVQSQKRRIQLLPAGLALLLLPSIIGAAVITNVVPVNVTPTSFSILWRTVSSTPSISVFADTGGLTNLAGQLGVEAFPLNSGNPDAPTDYDRRQSQIALRQKTEGLGLMLVRVTGCQPNTTYYYQLSSTPPGGNPILYPSNAPLPSVTTEKENTFTVNAQQLVIDVPGVDTLGRIVTVTHTNASHPLAAVVGDGVGTNQVFFELNDLFTLAGTGNFAPLGAQDFAVDVIGPNNSDSLAHFTVTFGTNFVIDSSTHGTLGTEFLSLALGSTVLRTGQATNVPVNFNSSAGISNLTLLLNVASGHLTNYSLQSLAPEIDPVTSAVIPQTSNTLLLRFAARAGQTITGSKAVGQLAFSAIAGQHSAFVPLTLTQITATKTDATVVTNLFGQSGRAVVIGLEGLLEAALGSNASRGLVLYGKPSSSYAIEYATNLINPVTWTRALHVGMTNLSLALTPPNGASGQIFYRAVEFFAEPPLLDATLNSDGSRQLTIFGRPGYAYLVQYTTTLFPINWITLSRIPLTNSFISLPVPNPGSGTVFYRVIEYLADPAVLDPLQTADGSRQVMLFGKPGSSYAIQYTRSLGKPRIWTTLSLAPMTNAFTIIPVGQSVPGSVFYRAYEFFANPPLLESFLNPDFSRDLLIYGQPSQQYTIEYNTNISNIAGWRPLLTYTLTNSFRYVDVTGTNGSIFYRLRKN